MKRILAIVLTVSMLCGLLLPVYASSADGTQTAEKIACDCPIIFVTGIGQTWTHLMNEDGTYKGNSFKNLREHNWLHNDEDPIDYNLFYADSNGLRQPGVMAALLRVIGQLLASAFFDRNFVSGDDLQTVLEAVMNRNIIDDNGKLPADVEDCLRPYPLSEYNDLDKYNFYFSIPCQFITEQVGEENVYCFNHFAFDYLYDDAEKLDDFIRNAVLGGEYNIHNASQVVLVPMSIDAYGDQGQVKRVVSLVGAWDGSDVIADLVEGKYSGIAPELLYHTLLPEMAEGVGGMLLLAFMRAFPKKVLREVIDTLVATLSRAIILRTPSLLAMLPVDRYPAIEQTYLQGAQYDNVRAQTRKYYAAQLRRDDNLARLSAQGTEFYFIAGYGMEHGAADFPYLRFMQSADTTNSDEIVPIWSAVPGVTWTAYNKTLGYTGKYVSPDGTIDLSTAFAPDRTWCFYKQKHQLEDNNTALRLAFDIAVGRVTSAAASEDVYPQFNESRDIDGAEGMIEKLTQYIEDNKDDPKKQADVERAQAMIDRLNAMLESTHNDRDADDAVLSDARQLLDELIRPTLKDVRRTIEKKTEAFVNEQVKRLNELSYSIFGAKGVIDKLLGR